MTLFSRLSLEAEQHDKVCDVGALVFPLLHVVKDACDKMSLEVVPLALELTVRDYKSTVY